ncbi:cation/H(+) antiporter 28-like [Cucurbita maxima]|uniref:Cation/H(+) antiporter 28-like n=1 Tax=Cucurbita maxima TaxID=3661 RepID=A0A6J1JVZ7_CUCMA|nr:cation/H(+) antiporter 28-like [Cucurbita maxima]
MAMTRVHEPSRSLAGNTCTIRLTEIFGRATKSILGFFLMMGLCNGVHYLLRPFSQPRTTSDTIVGLVVGNFMRKELDLSIHKTLRYIVDFGMTCYMFVLGLEMDPCVLFKAPTRDAKVAYAGMISTLILACSTIPFISFSKSKEISFILSLSTVLSSTASPVLTRLITNLKIGRSDIGRLVIAAGMHSDFISTLAICIGYLFCQCQETRLSITNGFQLGFVLLIQMIMAAKVSPVFMNWVNNENPEGKPMKGPHLVLAVAFMAFLCCCPTIFGYNPTLSAFLAGTFLPREGRVSRWAIGKINYLLTTVFYPIFFFWMGVESKLSDFEPGQIITWVRLLLLFAIVTVGKVVGTVIGGAILGFHWPESVALGLLLTMKGHFHIYLAISAKIAGKISTSTSLAMVFVIFFTVVHAPKVVAHIIKRARKRTPTHRMALELLDPSSELKILLCIHGPHNTGAAINIMEISRGTANPGVVVYVTDMIELTDEIAATLVQGEGVDTVTVTHTGVTQMRDQVTTAFQRYVDENGDGITLRRMLALSAFNCMAQDICILAEDLLGALIILPFHKHQRGDGSLSEGQAGFRYVNRKVIRHAPCSVGILVDRGLGSVEKISRSYVTLNVAVIFIGGKDDREALAYAGRVARHPGVKLSVIRFLVDADAENAARRAGTYRISVAEQEEEMRQDDECFAYFYERHVAGGHVAYVEKHMASSAETYSTLKSLEGQYTLVIVGRGGGVNSVLTYGMNDWQQCPELGPIGDVLSGSEFSAKTSVLIVHQHNLKGELDGLDDDFSIM